MEIQSVLCIDLLPHNLAEVISPNSFLINSLGFSTYQIRSSEKKKEFYFFFSNPNAF